jgi:hypothetical protein
VFERCPIRTSARKSTEGFRGFPPPQSQERIFREATAASVHMLHKPSERLRPLQCTYYINLQRGYGRFSAHATQTFREATAASLHMLHKPSERLRPLQCTCYTNLQRGYGRFSAHATQIFREATAASVHMLHETSERLRPLQCTCYTNHYSLMILQFYTIQSEPICKNYAMKVYGEVDV